MPKTKRTTKTERTLARNMSLPRRSTIHALDTSERQARHIAQKLNLEIRILEGQAELAKAAARRQILTCCKELVPVAIGFARKGRPRLLAVIGKILGDKNLVVNWRG